MDIAIPNAGGPIGPDPLKPASIAKKANSIGEQLNEMAGVKTERNLYEPKSKMDKDSFLKLFMQQLKYQDPLNPVKNEDFSQQMAMFSQLEQQVNMNKNLEKMLSQQNNMQIAALQLVGKNITADRAAIYHDKDKSSAIQFKLPKEVSDLNVKILDLNGEVVKAYDLGSRQEGDVSWRWDGLKENGAPADAGRYSYQVSGKGPDGKDINIDTKTEGRVTGVTSSNGVVFLLVGDQRIGLSDVQTIKEADNAGADKKDVGTKTVGNVAGGEKTLPSAEKMALLQQAQNALPSVGAESAGRSKEETEAIQERLEENLAGGKNLLSLMNR